MQQKNLTRREREKLMHREEMMAAALQLFSEKGFHNVSMHEIAHKAEFAIGTLYKFFKNKEDLYKALIMSKAEEYHGILKDVLTKEDDVRKTIKSYITAKARIFTDNVLALRLYLAETRGPSFNIMAGLDQDIRVLYDEVSTMLTAVFERGIKAKIFRKINPHYMAVALEGITNDFLICWLENPSRHPYEENVKMIEEMFLRGVMAK